MSIFVDTPLRGSRLLSILVPSAIGAGSQDVDALGAGYALDESGGYLLDENGQRILLQSGIGGQSDLLDEDGTKVLAEDGTKILTEDSGAAILGQATPIVIVSTSALYVDVAAKSTNTAVIWVGGSNVTTGLGIPLYPGEDSVKIDIDDLDKVYIYGLEGEGVTFIYGYTPAPLTLGGQLQFGGSDLQFGGSDLTFNP